MEHARVMKFYDALRFFRLVGLGMIGITGLCQAQLVLNIDDANSRLYFTGTTENVIQVGTSDVIWGTQAGDFDALSSATITANVLAGGGTATVDFYVDDESTAGLVVSPSALAGGVTFELAGGGEANSVSFSSLGLTVANITLLKSLNALNYTSGATLGISSITVNQVSAVPEPATFAAMLGMLVLAGVVSRRRRTIAG